MAGTESDLIPVADYARASADKMKDEHTVKDQQNANAQTAARLGCKIVARFSDNDKSAMKDGVVREEFEAMLRVIREGRLSDGTPVHRPAPPWTARTYRTAQPEPGPPRTAGRTSAGQRLPRRATFETELPTRRRLTPYGRRSGVALRPSTSPNPVSTQPKPRPSTRW